MEKKYEFTGDTKEVNGHVLQRIRCLRTTDASLREGMLGGWIENEANLSHEGTCWVDGEACVYENASVKGDAQVANFAQVSGAARLFGNSTACEQAIVADRATLFDRAAVCGQAAICDRVALGNDVTVSGEAKLSGYTHLEGEAVIRGQAIVRSNSDVVWFNHVGSELGTLTAYRLQDGGIGITRGCFTGTLDEFLVQVHHRHKHTRHKEEYLALVRYIKLRFREWAS